MEPWETIALLFAGLVAAAFSIVVLRAGPDQPANRALAALLWLEGLAQTTLGLALAFTPTGADINAPDPNAWAQTFDILRVLSIVSLSASYFFVLARLDTPLTRWLRNPWSTGTIVGLLAGLGIFLSWGWGTAYLEGSGFDATIIYPIYALVGLFALAATVAYVVRTAPGSLERRKAKAYALAFGIRDVATIAGFVVWPLSQAYGFDVFPWYVPIMTTGTILFVALLGYAFLRTQLFDIDLKIKIGIQRGTVAAIFVIAVFIAFQVAQQYLNKTYGIVASGMVTGALVFAAPRLNKFADKVSDKAMPKVTGTPEYLAFKKMEIYRAALEGALSHEDGIGARERTVLDRLRAQLGIGPADAQALEAELAPPHPAVDRGAAA